MGWRWSRSWSGCRARGVSRWLIPPFVFFFQKLFPFAWVNDPQRRLAAYSPEFLARTADELDSLPAGSAIEQMLADYQVMREQARACGRFGE